MFNQQKATQLYPNFGTTTSPSINYKRAEYTEAPRYVQVGVTYDW